MKVDYIFFQIILVGYLDYYWNCHVLIVVLRKNICVLLNHGNTFPGLKLTVWDPEIGPLSSYAIDNATSWNRCLDCLFHLVSNRKACDYLVHVVIPMTGFKFVYK